MLCFVIFFTPPTHITTVFKNLFHLSSCPPPKDLTFDYITLITEVATSQLSKKSYQSWTKVDAM